MNKKILITLLGLAIVLAGAFMFRSFTSQDNADDSAKVTPSPSVALANPASTFCVESGGISQIKETPDGQRGDCSFPSGATCEEWALFRGDCNVEGVSNTGNYSDGKNDVKVVYRIKTRTAILVAPSLGYEYLSLTQAVSASGARYLSQDGKIEFWEHQGEGKLRVDGKEVFVGKVK